MEEVISHIVPIETLVWMMQRKEVTTEWSGGNVFIIENLTPKVSGYTDNDCPANVRDRYTQVYRDKCYRFVVYASADYHNAKAYCVKYGGTLALVKSKSVNTFIRGRLALVYGLYGTAWIGLNDIETEGTFKWEDGTPMDFSNFVPGGSDGPRTGFFSLHGIEDCVAMDTNEYGQWRDYRCSDLLGGLLTKRMAFVCEFPVIETATTTSAPEMQTTDSAADTVVTTVKQNMTSYVNATA